MFRLPAKSIDWDIGARNQGLGGPWTQQLMSFLVAVLLVQISSIAGQASRCRDGCKTSPPYCAVCHAKPDYCFYREASCSPISSWESLQYKQRGWRYDTYRESECGSLPACFSCMEKTCEYESYTCSVGIRSTGWETYMDSLMIQIPTGETDSNREYCWNEARARKANTLGVYWNHKRGYCRPLSNVSALGPWQARYPDSRDEAFLCVSTKLTPYVIGTVESSSCPVGTTLVTSEDECRDAVPTGIGNGGSATYIGTNVAGAPFVVDSLLTVVGCATRLCSSRTSECSGDIYFSKTASPTATKPGHAPVCKRMSASAITALNGSERIASLAVMICFFVLLTQAIVLGL
eukprot:TRINITY_DN23015_c0_g1_i1.p1 TRINITY_DN23015_c0_g1~~TRINITY_DN23015_c0_g1_i1.p1  ORF type:complete len:348 (-),score=19.87 TRINITY_DN23015_c0_g1_i1:89-1132(-)